MEWTGWVTPPVTPTAGPADWLGHSTSHPYGGMVFFHAGSFFGNAGQNEWTGIALRIVGVWYGGINR